MGIENISNRSSYKAQVNFDNKQDIDKLNIGLKQGFVSNPHKFSIYFKDYLPAHKITAIATEKITHAIAAFLRPFNKTGMAKREVVKGSEQNYREDSEYNEHSKNVQKQFNSFNLTPPVPYYKLILSPHQNKELRKLLKNYESLSTDTLENLKSLAAKCIMKKYTIAELSVGERKALNEVNFQATQTHLYNTMSILNDPNSSLSKYVTSIKNNDSKEKYDYTNALIGEVLSKALAYTDGLDGRKIDIPVNVNGKMKLVTYDIKIPVSLTQRTDTKGNISEIRTPIKLGDNLPFYLLEPSKESAVQSEKTKGVNSETDYASPDEIRENKLRKAWVVIRGTEPLLKDDKEGVVESIAADFRDSDGVSALPIWQRSDELYRLFTSLKKEDSDLRINVTGHSLGASLAQAVAVIFNPLIDETFAFNSPGVDKQIAGLYKELDENVKKKVVVFHRPGDVISSGSPKRIGLNFEIQIENEDKEKNKVFERHSDMMLNTPHKQSTVDLKKDENNLMRRFADCNRRHVLSKVSYLIGHSNSFTWLTKRQELKDFNQAYFEHIQKSMKP